MTLTQVLPRVGDVINAALRVENSYASPRKFSDVPVTVRITALSGECAGVRASSNRL